MYYNAYKVFYKLIVEKITINEPEKLCVLDAFKYSAHE